VTGHQQPSRVLQRIWSGERQALSPQKVVALEWQRWIGKETGYVLVIAHIQLYGHPGSF